MKMKKKKQTTKNKNLKTDTNIDTSPKQQEESFDLELPPFIEKEKTRKNKELKIDKNQESKEPITNNNKGKLNFISLLTSFIAFIWLLALIGGFCLFFYLNKDKPSLAQNKLDSKESTVIYDAYKQPITELGLYLRQNIHYTDLPNNLIDAFLAIEDSRFFTHCGFDIPRFSKAIIKNLKNRDFGQGGSTLTMQLIKNSYFQIDNGDESTLASRKGTSGIKRKVQEIALAIEANFKYSKKDIFAYFLNKINFGNNIRGIEKAAQYYFDKNVKDLSLAESAFLAGIINAPNNYNPYNDIDKHSGNIYLNENNNYLANATKRRNEVIDLMLAHGYISEKEAKLTKTIKMENLLCGVKGKFATKHHYWQSYIDAVIDEVQSISGKDPYLESMEIYTGMDPHMQKYVYDLQNQNIEGYHLKFLDDKSQNAITILNNQNGSLVALGGGRNQTQSRMFNRATSAYIQPGSTIKPILEYALAFEWLGWATSHTICDRPYYLYNGHHLISNAGGQGYTGDMLLTEAVARSLNSPAVQTLQAVVEKTSEKQVIAYLNKIGFNFKNEDFDLQFAIGGNKMIVTPVQLAAAHAILMNKGRYIKPHTVTQIKFTDGTTYNSDTKGIQALSEEATYLTAFLEENNVSQREFGNLMNVLRSDYPVYAKTGTTDWADAGVKYGIPIGAARDLWLICQTSRYTISIWNGYDRLEKGAYFTFGEDMYNQKGYLGKAILDELNNHFKYNPHAITKPSGVSKITHIKGVFPYCEVSEGEPVTGLIKEKFNKLTNIKNITFETKKSGLVGVEANFGENGNLIIKWLGFSDNSEEGMCDISATNMFGETTQASGRCFFKKGRAINPQYFYADIHRSNGTSSTITSTNPNYSSGTYINKGESITVCAYTSEDSEQKCSDFTR